MLSLTAVLVPLSALTGADELARYGIWIYLLVFVVITLASTIIGGPIPDNTFLLLTGVVARDNPLSMDWLFFVAVIGGYSGYEINYWSGRLFGLAICRRACPLALADVNIQKALRLIDSFGPASLILSRFMPVMNLPSFIAGMNMMEYRKYAVFNILSSAVWSGILLFLGYYIGSIRVISEYLDIITDLFFIFLIAAIIFALVVFTRDYLRQKNQPEP